MLIFKILGFLSILSLASLPMAWASGELCAIKQKNAASFEFAQSRGIPVQQVEIGAFDPGMWTLATANNVGSDVVTVQAKIGPDQATVSQSYRVAARQLGNSSNCTITQVMKAED